MMKNPLGAAAAVLEAALPGACASPPADPAAAAPSQPRVACPALQGMAIPASEIGLPTSGARITSATLVIAAPETVGDKGVTRALPEYCRILGAYPPDAPYPLQGGREAMEVAQRYPEDYDGVVATAPLIGYSAHVIPKTLLATVQTGSGWIPPAKQAAIGAEVLRQCDGLDGRTDGVINHYLGRGALFDPRRVAQPYAAIRCAGGADTCNACVSDAQIATLNQMHTPTKFGFELANGWSETPDAVAGRESQGGWLNIATQPDAPVVSTMEPLPPYTVGATRPMCRYPLHPRYQGSGDPAQAASYRCVP